jgi:hypothetical protein
VERASRTQSDGGKKGKIFQTDCRPSLLLSSMTNAFNRKKERKKELTKEDLKSWDIDGYH